MILSIGECFALDSVVWALQVPGSLPNDPAGFQLRDHFAIATAVSSDSEQLAPAQPPPRIC